MTLDARHTVVFLIVTSFGLTALELPADSQLGTAGLSLASGVAALSLMAMAALLGSRWRWLEDVFGGLDRVYRVHKWLGVWALGLASVHLAFKAGLPAWEVAAILPLPAGTTRLLRQLAFLGLMLTLLLALNRSIPYATWRWWHRLSGPIFLIVVAHWLSIRSPIGLLSPAGLWLAALAALGVAGAAWKLLLYPWLSPHAGYRIVEATPGPGAVRLELLPTGKPIEFEAGQFGFLGLQVEGLRAPHPFTLACAPDDAGRVVFMIRALGEHTRRLVDRAAVGMHAVVHGPFGRFKRRAHSAGEVWIAGGVGISPFLAWLDDPHSNGLERVHLFYFYTPGRGFPEPDALAKLAGERKVALHCLAAGPADPAFIRALETCVRSIGAEQVDVDICGPPGLLQACCKALHACGVGEARIRHELFEFR
jgi:predicted ferric reductase